MARDYVGPLTKDIAVRRARATCAAVAAARGVAYPMQPGASYGRVVPTARALARARTLILAPVREALPGDWWVEVPVEARALPDAPVRFEGGDVDPVRSGTPTDTTIFTRDAP